MPSPTGPSAPDSRPLTVLILMLVASLALGGLTGCTGKEVKGQNGPPGAGAKGGSGKMGPRAVVVTAAPVVQKAMPLQITPLIGTVEPIQTVTIKPRIAGEIEKVHFTEGQEVKKGDILFTLDRLPMEAALKQAEAALARDQVTAANARVDARRYQDLIQRGAVAPAEYDKIKATYDAQEASVRADQAAVESARLLLDYAEIRSPLSGRTGSLSVDQGNIVKANETELVTINQVSPIYVSFSADENHLPAIRRYMAEGTLSVSATIRKDTGAPEQGKVTFINNTVTAGSGQIMLRGTFGNEDHRLWPGQFVDVTLQLTVQPQALVMPAAAIQNSQTGTFVFVIQSDMTVEARPVKIDRQIGPEAVIAAGLKAGERVVTDGQLLLVPGAKVELKGARKAGGAEKAKPEAGAPAHAGKRS